MEIIKKCFFRTFRNTCECLKKISPANFEQESTLLLREVDQITTSGSNSFSGDFHVCKHGHLKNRKVEISKDWNQWKGQKIEKSRNK